MAEKILIIDDDIISQNVVRSTLTQAGYSVIVASDGDDGVRKASEHLPDLIILDIMMPGRDGGEVAAILRAGPGTKDVPIIFVSSLIQGDEVRPCDKDNKLSFLSKPYKREVLLNEVRKRLEAERKYSPLLLHALVAGRFFLEEDMRGKIAVGGEIPKHEFSIFIRNLDNKSRCYKIGSEPNGETHVLEGACTGTICRPMQPSTLYEKKDILGEVIIKRNFLRIKEYRTYEEFWTDIRRDRGDY
jgi:CheY-like chemotaxis protein